MFDWADGILDALDDARKYLWIAGVAVGAIGGALVALWLGSGVWHLEWYWTALLAIPGAVIGIMALSVVVSGAGGFPDEFW